MAPIQIVLLLILARLPAALAPQPTTTQASTSLTLTLLASYLASHLLLITYLALRGKSAIRQLHSTTTSAAAIASQFERLLPYARWCTLAFVALHLFFPHGQNLPAVIRPLIDSTRLLKHIPLLAEAIYLAPPLLTWIAFWIVQYFVESAHRERSLPYRLASALPTHEMPSLWQFLSMQIRHNFYLLLPILIVTLIQHLADLAESRFPNASWFAIPLSLLVFVLMTPWLITRVWATVPLTGPLRHRLDGAAAHYRLRFKNILVWKTHNAITNAAILGYLPFSRYFLMTDALLESLTDQQLEAVFAHEVGHGHHRHLWWYFAGFTAAIIFTASAANLLAPLLPLTIIHMFDPVAFTRDNQSTENTSMILSLILLLPCILLGFPYISHRFEHQADWFAANHMAYRLKKHPQALPLPAAALVNTSFSLSEGEAQIERPQHKETWSAPDADVPASPFPPVSLSPSPPLVVASPAAGAEIFISALETIVDLAHRSRDHRGWMHPSINNRIHLLRQLAIDTTTQKQFGRRQRNARLLIIGFITLTVILAALSLIPPASAPGQDATTAPAQSQP